MVEDLSGSMSFPRSSSGTQQRGYKSIRLPKDELFNNIRAASPPIIVCLPFSTAHGFADIDLLICAGRYREDRAAKPGKWDDGSQCGSHVVPLVIV